MKNKIIKQTFTFIGILVTISILTILINTIPIKTDSMSLSDDIYIAILSFIIFYKIDWSN